MLAQLDHIQLMSEEPEKLISFYRDIMGLSIEQLDSDLWLCQGPQRCLILGRGRLKSLGFGAYRCESMDDLVALRTKLVAQNVALSPSPSPLFSTDAFAFRDPDGNQLVFGVVDQQSGQSDTALQLSGRLQHLTLASENVEVLVDFYSRVVGLVVSDKMLDGTAIGACWMRTSGDKEHHSLAIFRAPTKEVDHHSYELDNWMSIRDWADYLASKGIKLFWGPGRHGPGNNLFIFILDPDGNKIELSAELEIISENRPTGIWRHEPDTLNLWGPSFMRS